MNDEEIKKCLECCISLSCEGCPLKNNHGCLAISDENALDLINRQQAEIERLKSLCTSKDVIIKEQQADIERLESLLNQLFKDVDYKLQYIYELEKKLESDQSEAIKECVNKYTEMLIDEYHLRTDLQIESIKRLEQKVMTEMVGGENA